MTIKSSFDVDVYSCTVNIIISDNILRCVNYRLKKMEDTPMTGSFGALCVYCKDADPGNYYLFFDLHTIDTNFINHEKSHLVEAILKDRGIRPVDEVRSYLDGYVSEKITAFIKKKKIKLY